MKFRRLLLFCTFLFPFTLYAAEDIIVNYSYAGNHGVDLSDMRITLQIGEFSDARAVDNSRLITADYQAEEALPAIIRDALIQGFENGNAQIVATDGDMSIAGRLLSSELQMVDRNGVESIQLTMRTNVQLQRSGRTIWETTLFGRGVVPSSEGLTAAVHAALDRMIRELVNDDYFLIEIQ